MLIATWTVSCALAADPYPTAKFIRMGDLDGGRQRSRANAVSADGSTVVGYSESAAGTEACVWRDGVLVGLGFLDGGEGFSQASDVSADGKVVVGHGKSANGVEAFRWQDGRMIGLGDLPGSDFASNARAVSADGKTVVGEGKSARGTKAFIWRDGAMQPIDADASGFSYALDVSADGSVVVGYGRVDGNTLAIRWQNGSPTALGELAGGDALSIARTVSSDGSVVAGDSRSVWGAESFRWQNGKMEGLGSLYSDHGMASSAAAISTDGSVIAGHSTSQKGPVAVIWDRSEGMRSLFDVLMEEHGLDTYGWIRTRASDVSADGRTIVGYGTNPDGIEEGWIVRLPPKRSQLDLFAQLQRSPTDPVSRAIDESGTIQQRFGRHRLTLDNLSCPTGIAVDSSGSIVVVECDADRIGRFDASGERTGTFRHGVVRGIDDLRSPHGLAVGPKDVLYVADTGNDRIARFNPQPFVHSSLGWGRFGTGPSEFNRPEGVHATAKHVYVADTGNHRVQVFDLSGTHQATIGEYGEAQGQFIRPTDLTVDDAGFIYVADTGNHRIQKFSADGKFAKAWGGVGKLDGFFRSPTSVCIVGNQLHVADSGNHRVQVFSTDGEFAYAWGRPAVRPHESGGALRLPTRLAASADGSTVWVCEPDEGRCVAFDPQWVQRFQGPRGTAAGTAAGYVGERLSVGGDMLAVPSILGDSFRLYDVSGQTPFLITSVDGTSPGAGRFRFVSDVLINDERHELIVCDRDARKIHFFSYDESILELSRRLFGTRHPDEGVRLPAGTIKLTHSFEPRMPGSAAGASSASAETEFVAVEPSIIRRTTDGGLLLLDQASRAVVQYGADFAFVRSFGHGDGDGASHAPADMAVDAGSGRVLIADGLDRQVRVFDRDGRLVETIRELAGAPMARPCSVAAAGDAGFWLVDQATSRIMHINAQRELVISFGSPGLGPGELHRPTCIAVDEMGRVFVADAGNHRGVMFNAEGDFRGAFGPKIFTLPANFP